MCDLRRTTYNPSYPSQPVTADQLGTFALQSFSTNISQTLTAGIRVPYLNMSATGRPFFNDAVGTGVGNGPFTIVVAGKILTFPGATLTGNVFAFGNTASNTPHTQMEITNASTIVVQRHNGTSAKTLTAFATDGNAHVWSVQYNGVSSFVRQDMVQQAAGDLGTAGSAYNTFALGALRGNIFYNADSIQGYVGAAVAQSAVTMAELQQVERFFARYLKLF